MRRGDGGAARGAGEGLSFLHLSDLHFLRDYRDCQDPFRDVLLAMTPPLAQLDRLLRGVPKPPDFVLLTGDLCHAGREADYAALRGELALRFPGLPLYALPGNHDRRDAFVRVFARGDAARVRAVEQAGLRLLLLDNTLPGSPDGGILPEDVDALRPLLAPGSPPCVLATHHHLVSGQFALPPAAFPPSFPALLRENAPLAILTGHTHHPYRGAFAGVPALTAGSLCFRGHNGPEGVRMDESPAAHFFTLTDGALSVRLLADPAPPRPLGTLSYARLQGMDARP